jgi:hypothetical protein
MVSRDRVREVRAETRLLSVSQGVREVNGPRKHGRKQLRRPWKFGV